MAGLLALRDKFDLAFANDPDYDRHGIVTPAGLMNPNHYLAVAINYLFQHRPQWGKEVAVGKTLLFHVAGRHGRIQRNTLNAFQAISQ